MRIVYLKHNEIDKQKWDACLKNSYNTHIYAFSWYLDCMAGRWDALVMDDYQKIMPLPYKKIMGCEYITTPPFIHQLGIFSINKISAETVQLFLDAIPKKFAHIYLALNKFNKLPGTNYIINKQSFEIDLIQDYSKIFDNYGINTKNTVFEFEKQNLTIRYDINIKTGVEFFKKYSKHSSIYKRITFKNLYTLVNTLTKFGLGKFFSLHNKKGDLVGLCFFLIYMNKSSLLFYAYTPEIKFEKGQTYLINEFLRMFSNKNITFDIAISETSQHKLFYKNELGCMESTYPIYQKFNKIGTIIKSLRLID
ncbi:MAG: hypothetical protein SNJ71_01175 [Bacteroidales bacterium]